MTAKRKPAGLWDTYLSVVESVVGGPAAQVGASTVTRLLGFWLTWHLFDGYDGMRTIGWSQPGLWKNRMQFRQVFGVEVEDFMPAQQPDVIRWREEPVNFPKYKGASGE